MPAASSTISSSSTDWVPALLLVASCSLVDAACNWAAALLATLPIRSVVMLDVAFHSVALNGSAIVPALRAPMTSSARRSTSAPSTVVS
jgi:hypothetical protein